ncbi:hypothetical protein EHO60_13485 [Leptospira fletcheri]|uniref:Uncharacterized protein n=1 Tax=Leptospira fletcheri TaxID=2484981 RepID=A0A4R9GB72_9LEPT|nr:hypothetical protein [Leptospira fletcheri]TGK09026.1 hypothetical protein EHO60_13485 [Leptospira fletcheri]
MNRRILFLTLIAFCVPALVYLGFFWIPAEAKKEDSVLQGGLSRRTVSSGEGSLFDRSSDFMRFAEPTEEIEHDDTTAKEGTSSESDRKEEERAKLLEQSYERFKPLAARFPNNRMIPKRLSQEETAKRREEEIRYDSIQSDLLEKREVLKEDLSFYLDQKLKRSDDMLEILKYGLESAQKSVPSATEPNAEYLKIVRERIENIEKNRSEVLSAKKNLEDP